MEGLQSEDGALIKAQKECFQMLLRSGLLTKDEITEDLVRCIGAEITKCKEGDGDKTRNKEEKTTMDSTKKEKLGNLVQILSALRKGVVGVAALDFVHEVWTSTSSMMTQIEVNPAFLMRTPSMIYSENMDIGQPLLLSPSLRSHSITSLQRQNSLQNVEPLSRRRQSGIIEVRTAANSNHSITTNGAYLNQQDGDDDFLLIE